MPSSAAAFHRLEKRLPLIQWDWGKINPHVVETTCEYIEHVAKDFPLPFRLLCYVGVSTDQHFFGANGGGQPWASVIRNGERLLLNAKWYQNTNKMLTNISHNEIAGFHPDGTDSVAFPVVHELGHLVNDWLDRQKNIAIRYDGEVKSLSAITSAWVRKHAGSKTLSEYSLANHREALAEGFTSLYYSPELTPYAQELQKFLRQVFDQSQWQMAKKTK